MRDDPNSESARFGHYTLIRELGRGGQGIVWLAEDSKLGRKVALKVLNSGPATGTITDREIARFRREAEAASKLDHPNICTLLDVGDVDGVPFLAFRYVDGETLNARIERAASVRRGESTEQAVETDPSSKGGIHRVVAVFEKIARALHKAHEKGLIHRDVKPGNIMLTSEEGEPVILDFGLARDEIVEGVSLTHSGDLLGTPAYMSPEQLMAHRVPLDRRTDIYSLGATLYECLTLERPFTGLTRAELYQQILHADPSSSASLNKQIPRDLQVVIETAMEKDRDRRYQSALDLAEDLRRFHRSERVHARPIGRWLRVKRWAQRHPTAATGVGLVFAGLVLSLVMLDQMRRERDLTRAAGLAAASSLEVTRNPMLALLLALESVEIDDTSLENHAALHEALAEVRETKLIPIGATPIVSAIAISPDDSRIAVAQGSLVKVIDLTTAVVTHRLSQGDTIHDVEFSPDGTSLATAGADAKVCVWDLANVEASPLRIGHDAEVRTVTFTADGRILSSAGSTAVMWSSTDRFRQSFRQDRTHSDEKGLRFAQLSPLGDRIVTMDEEAVMRIWSGEERDPQEVPSSMTLRDDGDTPALGAMSKDGTVLAKSKGGNEAIIWGIEGDSALEFRIGHGSAVSAVAFHPSPEKSELVLTASYDQTARITDTGANAVLCEFRGHSGRVVDAVFAHSGEFVITASEDGTVRMWDARGVLLPTIHAHAKAIHCLRTLPNGSIVTGERRGDPSHVRVWSPAGDLENSYRARSKDGFFLDVIAAGSGTIVASEFNKVGEFAQVLRGGEFAVSTFRPKSGFTGCASPKDPSLLLLLGGDGEAWKWRVPGPPPTEPFYVDPAGIYVSQSVCFHPDGKRWIASTYGTDVVLRDLEGRPVRSFDSSPHPVWRCDISHDGRWLVATNPSPEPLLWDLRKDVRQPVRRLRGHGSHTVDAEFSPRDSEIVVTVSRDKTARIWNVIDGKCLAILRGHTGIVWNARFRADGQRIYTSSFDGTVRTWFVSVNELIDAARARKTRDFTETEIDRYRLLLGR